MQRRWNKPGNACVSVFIQSGPQMSHMPQQRDEGISQEKNLFLQEEKPDIKIENFHIETVLLEWFLGLLSFFITTTEIKEIFT